MRERGTVSWKIGPPPASESPDGRCIAKSDWGHRCELDAGHTSFCFMILDPDKRKVKITYDTPPDKEL